MRDLKPPVSRYQPSERAYPETLPALEYGPDLLVRRVGNGAVSLHGHRYWVGEVFAGQPVGLRQTSNQPSRCHIVAVLTAMM